jgi:hypothetical protein
VHPPESLVSDPPAAFVTRTTRAPGWRGGPSAPAHAQCSFVRHRRVPCARPARERQLPRRRDPHHRTQARELAKYPSRDSPGRSDGARHLFPRSDTSPFAASDRLDAVAPGSSDRRRPHADPAGCAREG